MEKTEEAADRFVEALLTEGAQAPCDNTVKSFEESDDIPPFYDEDLFRRKRSKETNKMIGETSATSVSKKPTQGDSRSTASLSPVASASFFGKKNNHKVLNKYHSAIHFKWQVRGQEFYHRNIFGVVCATIFGVISILSIPTILKVLIYTRMSGSEMAAYRRYMATIFHITTWYDSEFRPGSKLWQSITEVKKMHNSVSNRGRKAGINRISQKDMALTQFAFIGFQLMRSEYFGIYDATEEEWKTFIHLWRVTGHALGIEDRFNICRGSVAETRAICEKLVEQVFIPHIEKQEPKFLEMTQYLIDGLRAMQPILNFNAIMYTLQILLGNKMTVKEGNNKLSFWEKCIFYFMGWTFMSLRLAPFRWYSNFTVYRDLWFMKNFPFLAYYKFGYANAHVMILTKDS